jgi:hypothetical protein
MTKIVLHWIALFIEALGTLLVWLDTERLNARFPSEPGVIGTVGDPLGYRVWYYHCSTVGFLLLFLGILVAGFVLLLEHQELHHRKKKP